MFTEDKAAKTRICLRSYLHLVLVRTHKANIIPWLFKMCMTDIAEKSSKLHHAVARVAAKDLNEASDSLAICFLHRKKCMFEDAYIMFICGR